MFNNFSVTLFGKLQIGCFSYSVSKVFNRASEGTAMMSEEQLLKDYGPDLKYPSEKFKQLCKSGNGGSGFSFMSCNFYVPSLALFGRMLDTKGKTHEVTYEIAKCAARVYSKENFRKSTNFYFPVLKLIQMFSRFAVRNRKRTQEFDIQFPKYPIQKSLMLDVQKITSFDGNL